MTLKDTFCPSPWFHMRINNSGTYEFCRWQVKDQTTRVNFNNNIQTISPLTYFQKNMSELRTTILSGHASSVCNDCYTMEQHGKVSGRQRQLLKVGILDHYFEKSLASSTLKLAFDYSSSNQGHTDRTIMDWQIDLGNYCNSACVFCSPESSSKLATEFKKLGMIDQMPPPSWCEDPGLLDQFVQVLTTSKDLKYLHFIGGETLITPGFKTILAALVNADLARHTIIGFTTNLNVWSDDIVELLKQFQQVNLGMSIEALTPVNDYVRYPSQLDQTIKLLQQWCTLGQSQHWLMQLRITPTCLTVQDLTTVYEYAWQNNIAVESCNFLNNPKFLRISVLPTQYRSSIIQKLDKWIQQHQPDQFTKIINTRDPNIARNQIVQDAQSYLTYLKAVDDESHRIADLVEYLKLLESNRNNSILTYLPQYEQLFRSAGY